MSFEMACKFIRETESAVLIEDPATGEEHWIPLSQVDRMVRDKRGGDTGTISMTDWIAQQKGLA